MTLSKAQIDKYNQDGCIVVEGVLSPSEVARLSEVTDEFVENSRKVTEHTDVGVGSAVEWHQDWAFYPATNDDPRAVGVMMDDRAVKNGPLMFLPGSHQGPVHDHHVDGGLI